MSSRTTVFSPARLHCCLKGFLSVALLVAVSLSPSLGQAQETETQETETSTTCYPNRTFESNWASLDQRDTPQWYHDAKFGIFIHWGVYSVPSWAPTDRGDGGVGTYAEWYWRRLFTGDSSYVAFHDSIYGEEFEYQDFAPRFKAELFAPEKWASLFKEAGARYVVLTSKHHDGFALWPSAESYNWNSADIGPHKDLAGELATAVRGAGLKMGFYYSLYEWFHPYYSYDPDDPQIERYVTEHMLPQMKDLVRSYEPSVLWADGEWDYSHEVWHSTEFLSWLFNESPVCTEVAVNDRWGKNTRGKHGGFYTSEYGGSHGEETGADVRQHIWEETRGMGHSFGFNRNEDASDYMTSEELIHLLVNVVSRGGNLLLNVGPTADGRIPPIMQDRLLDIGAWLDVNGDAIYKSEPWSSAPSVEDVRFTQRGDAVYAILLNWPEEQLSFPIEEEAEVSVSLLGHDGDLSWRYENGQIHIDPPTLSVDEVPTQHAHVLKVDGLASEAGSE